MSPADSPRAVIRRHSRSFSLAAGLLGRDARRRAEGLYAWCRAADDAVDLAPTPAAALGAVRRLREGLDAVYSGASVDGDAAALALREAAVASDIPRRYPEELLDGMAMDAAGVRYETVDELLVYCHRVAGVVGLMMCHALGVTDARALPHAAHLGIAMQLTNIARDVGEDWARGRLYLPAEWAGEAEPGSGPPDDEALAPAIRRALALADQYYASGDAGLKYLRPRARLGVRVARKVYSSIGVQVARAGFRASAGRAVTPGRRKAWLVLTSLAAGVAELPFTPTPARGTPLGVWEFRPISWDCPEPSIMKGE